jgi:hypothetical protein
VRVTLQRRGGARRTVKLAVRVPRDLRPGARTLVLTGNGFAEETGFIIELIEGELAASTRGATRPAAARARSAQSRPRRPAARSAQSPHPRSVRRLARRIAAMRRPLGIEARFGRRDPDMVLRSDDVRFDGRVKLRLRVSRARR